MQTQVHQSLLNEKFGSADPVDDKQMNKPQLGLLQTWWIKLGNVSQVNQSRAN